MLKKLRFWTRTYLRIDLFLSLVKYAFVGIVSAVALVAAVNRGDHDAALGLVAPVIATASIFGLGWWITRDARKSYRELRDRRSGTSELGPT
jgi:energy-converting hydrogenase Eha subunit H